MNIEKQSLTEESLRLSALFNPLQKTPVKRYEKSRWTFQAVFPKMSIDESFVVISNRPSLKIEYNCVDGVKIPGRQHWDPIKIKFYSIDSNSMIANALTNIPMEEHSNVMNRGSGDITLYDHKMTQLECWHLNNLILSQINWSMSAINDNFIDLEIEIYYDGCEYRNPYLTKEVNLIERVDSGEGD